jgi:hypothetical protein
MKGGDLKNTALKYAMSFGQGFLKNKVCSGDAESIKANAIRALEAMPASAVTKLVQQSPICSSQGSVSMSSMFGGKKAKTRKLKRKQRKTRKH